MLAENVGANALDVRPFMIDLITQTSYGFVRTSRSRLIEPAKEALSGACRKWISKLFSVSSERMIHEPRNIGDFHSIIEEAIPITPLDCGAKLVLRMQVHIQVQKVRQRRAVHDLGSRLMLGVKLRIGGMEPTEVEKGQRPVVDEPGIVLAVQVTGVNIPIRDVVCVIF